MQAPRSARPQFIRKIAAGARYGASVLLLCWGLLTTAIIWSRKPSLYGNNDFSAAIFDRHKKLLRLTLTRDEKYRLWAPLKTIEPKLVAATLMQEDRYFYLHPGVNPWALGRAVISTFTGNTRLGASTITMQVARLRYHLQTRSIKGKLRQTWEALLFEHSYSKNELLEAYLNLAPYGGNIEGVAAAAQIYFRKAAADLTLADAMLLSVLPQKPTLRAPRSDKSDFVISLEGSGLAAARSRLLDKWVKENSADEGLANEIRMAKAMSRRSQLPFRAPHLIGQLMQDHQPALGHQPLVGEILSTLDLDLQSLVERRLTTYIERKKAIGIRNGVAMLVDHRTMDVVALVGSANFSDQAIQGQVNGTRAKRSPGSTLKPFIYGLAIDQGLIHPMTMLKDAPTSFGDWAPENFDRGFTGPVKATDALVRSRNVPAIQLTSRLKKPSLYEFLKKAGVTELKDEGFYGLALALGGAEVTIEDLARLYAMLPNGGEIKPLRYLVQEEIAQTGPPLLSPEAADLVLRMLQENPRPAQGYDQRWTMSDRPVAWKTGTSYSFRDAWAAGIVGPYVLVVWLGNFDGESNPALIGLDAAGPLFFEIIDALSAYHGERRMPPVAPRGLTKIKTIEVCALSGKVPGPFCQHRIKTGFIPGKSPIEVCDIHREVTIDLLTGLRACDATPTAKQGTEIFEFWPSDLLHLFRQAGIPRRTPPPFGPECLIAKTSHRGNPPKILSPKTNTIYNIRMADHGSDPIPLQAATDADAREVHWFANNIYLGHSAPTKAFFWTPIPGLFAIRAVDNLGRSASRDIKISIVE